MLFPSAQGGGKGINQSSLKTHGRAGKAHRNMTFSVRRGDGTIGHQSKTRIHRLKVPGPPSTTDQTGHPATNPKVARSSRTGRSLNRRNSDPNC